LFQTEVVKFEGEHKKVQLIWRC